MGLGYPKIGGLQWEIHPWMIWGYPYFRKPPYIYSTDSTVVFYHGIIKEQTELGVGPVLASRQTRPEPGLVNDKPGTL